MSLPIARKKRGPFLFATTRGCPNEFLKLTRSCNANRAIIQLAKRHRQTDCQIHFPNFLLPFVQFNQLILHVNHVTNTCFRQSVSFLLRSLQIASICLKYAKIESKSTTNLASGLSFLRLESHIQNDRVLYFFVNSSLR